MQQCSILNNFSMAMLFLIEYVHDRLEPQGRYDEVNFADGLFHPRLELKVDHHLVRRRYLNHVGMCFR